MTTKSSRVSRTLLGILADLKNTVVWTVSTHPVISKSSSSGTNPLGTIPRAPITIGIIVTFMFHSFFNSLARSRFLSYFSHPFNFYCVVSRNSKIHNPANCLFLLIIIRSGCLAEIRWTFWMSKSQGSLCVSFSWTDSWLYIYHLFVWSNFNFFHNSQWITLPTQSCLVLYTFCTNFLHSLIMWLIVSSLSPHNLHLLFCWILFIVAFIWSVLMALFCAAIKRDSFSLFRVSFS